MEMMENRTRECEEKLESSQTEQQREDKLKNKKSTEFQGPVGK